MGVIVVADNVIPIDFLGIGTNKCRPYRCIAVLKLSISGRRSHLRNGIREGHTLSE
jgi:hypothetical protein